MQISRGRRSALASEASRRCRERRARLGGQIKALRLRRRWTQAGLAERAGLGRLIVGRAERNVGPIDLEALERISMALGVALVVDLGRDPLDDVADAGHLAMQELVLRVTRKAGFEVRFELPSRPGEPWRSIDVAVASEALRLAIQVECWNTIGDVGAATRSSGRKQAELGALAVARWGTPARVGSVWVVRATSRNQALIARYPEVFAARFPGSSRAWIGTLTNGSEPPGEPGLVWSDVGATRLFAWRRR